jgi:hypothetical protein
MREQAERPSGCARRSRPWMEAGGLEAEMEALSKD